MNIDEPVKKREFETVLPMINIVFLLLIFFMLAGAFTKPDMFDITVPEASTKNAADLDDITILMSEKKAFAIADTSYSQDELTDFIRRTIEDNNNASVQLKADQKVTSNDLIDTMEALGSTGLQSIKLLTVMPSKSAR
ncbi:biopolymer transporter ExbD [bacterium]|nr:biopolymer transporter ExbD [bacterium]